MIPWPATPDRFAFNKRSTLPHQPMRRLEEAEKENWHKRSVHANLQNVTRNLKRAKRRLRISRPGVRVPSIAPKNAVRPKGLAAFLFVRKCLHSFCTLVNGQRQAAALAILPAGQTKRPASPMGEAGLFCRFYFAALDGSVSAMTPSKSNRTPCGHIAVSQPAADGRGPECRRSAPASGRQSRCSPSSSWSPAHRRSWCPSG